MNSLTNLASKVIRHVFVFAIYLFGLIFSLVIAGAGIWISLFALGWFLAMIGIL